MQIISIDRILQQFEIAIAATNAPSQNSHQNFESEYSSYSFPFLVIVLTALLVEYFVVDNFDVLLWVPCFVFADIFSDLVPKFPLY